MNRYERRKARSEELALARLDGKGRLEERKEAAARARAEREAHWLAQERPPLGGRKPAKPLSRMPA